MNKFLTDTVLSSSAFVHHSQKLISNFKNVIFKTILGIDYVQSTKHETVLR